jgi:hypothetical protein
MKMARPSHPSPLKKTIPLFQKKQITKYLIRTIPLSHPIFDCFGDGFRKKNGANLFMIFKI